MTTALEPGPVGVSTPNGRAKPHPTPAERAAHGRAVRSVVPRSSLGEWAPAPDRRDPVELLEQQARTRVQELVPIRHGRMLVSAFTFYRGGAFLMAEDLDGAPRTGLTVQLCGDAHLSNFGAYAAPDRRLVFSVNDFDETLPGPFEWDVKRLVASFAVAGRDRGFDARQREAINRTVGKAYRESMRDFAGQRQLDLWYARIDVDDIAARLAQQANPKEMRRFERNLAKTRSKDSMKALGKLTEIVDGHPRIIGDPPLIVTIEDVAGPDELPRVEGFVREILHDYRRSLPNDRRHLIEQFHYAHAARKVVGVGSVGTRAWIALMQGRDAADPLFLQVKEAEPSVLEPYLGRSAFSNHGKRVVEGQRLMQAASDLMLGWVRLTGVDGVVRDFYVRQLWDQKGSAIVETMTPRMLTAYAHLCGWTLAKAHARSGDPVAIAGYLGSGATFDRALAAFAETYADQNERDFAAFRDAVAAGRLRATTGL
ncbi:MAG TPA: DUF2252 domain-containing protein [Baekduia sp.]